MIAIGRESFTNTSFAQIRMMSETERSLVWVRMRYPGRPCMSHALLQEIVQAQGLIARRAQHELLNKVPQRLSYQVLASDQAGVFNLGGDLEYFLQLIGANDVQRLSAYARTCIDLVYGSATNYQLPFTTMALVQGQALGGGFEAALASTVIIAEQSASFGFPETLFGLFPGMGALSLLMRRVAPGMAKRIITSGKLYTAKELYDLGVVDVLVEDGRGEQAVYDYIEHRQYRESGYYALDKALDRVQPISREELTDIVDLWVDTAMKLSEKNLRLMGYLLKAQQNRWGNQANQEGLRITG